MTDHPSTIPQLLQAGAADRPALSAPGGTPLTYAGLRALIDTTIAASLAKAGFKAPITDDIRGEIWLKLWGNLSFNPISALTHATLVDLLRFPLTRELCANMMREAEAIATALGITIKVGIDRRLAGAEKVGAHKTSMLQDLEQGRQLELDALVGSVVELGRLTGIPTPHIDAVFAVTSLLAKTVADHGGRLALPEPAHVHTS